MSRRTGFTGSALIRLLARLTDIDVPDSRQAFADRLGRWVDWTDAIALSAALNAAASPSNGPPVAHARSRAGELECARMRTALAHPLDGVDPSPSDFAPLRRHYEARQRGMEASIGPLRDRLRATLASASRAMAGLATLDAAMEQLLGPRERTLLSAVPLLLERRFEHLRQAAASSPSPVDQQPPPGWSSVFRQDMQDVLLAELDVRMKPVEGLLEALRAS